MSGSGLEGMKRYNCLLGEMDAVYHEMALRFGLSDSAMRIIYILLDCKGTCKLRELCRISGMSKQTVNSSIRRLEKDKTVSLHLDDGKGKTVSLTDSGRALAMRTAGRILEAENKIFDSWSEQDAEKYLELTEDFLMQLKKAAQTF